MEAVIERCFARGELDEADRWQTKLDEWRAASLLAYERRCRITPHTKLMRHGLDAELIAQLQGQLRERIPEQTRRWISGLWLARKRDVAFLPNEPLYIIGFTCRWALLRRDGAEIKRLLDEQIELPSQLIAVDLSPVNMMRLREHISSIDGSRLI
jgi:aryl carrier-like protein